jgi:integrase
VAFVRRRGGTWYVGYRDERGRQVQRATSFGKSEARRIAQELEHRAERIRLGLEMAAPERMLAKDVVEKYRTAHVTGTRSEQPTNSRLDAHVLPWVRDRLIHEIGPADADAFLARKRTEISRRTQRSLTPRSLEQLRVLCHAIFDFAIDRLKVYRGGNPFEDTHIDVPKTTARYLRAEQVPLVIQHAPDDLRGLFATAFLAGLRKGELCGLLVEDIDLDALLIHVRHSYEHPTKGSRERSVAIPEELIPYLKVELGRARSRWLFPNAAGRMRTKDWDLADIFRTAMKSAGLVQGYDHRCVTRGKAKSCGFVKRFSDDAARECPKCGRKLHVEAVPLDFTFRHSRSTYGTYLYRATGDLRHVQNSLGHQDASTTEQHYAHVLSEHRMEQANRLKFGLNASDLPVKADEKGRNKPTRTKVVVIKTEGNR